MKELRNIQSNLNAPKGQKNTFGKYNYRSCEDILAAVKPLLTENNAQLIINDGIVLIGDRYYVKSTAVFSAGDSEVAVSAFARESESKKGMDSAQITGAASSYARKYALNGLFAIDDTKDDYATDKHETQEKPKKSGKLTSGDWETQFDNAFVNPRSRTPKAVREWRAKHGKDIIATISSDIEATKLKGFLTDMESLYGEDKESKLNVNI